MRCRWHRSKVLLARIIFSMLLLILGSILVVIIAIVTRKEPSKLGTFFYRNISPLSRHSEVVRFSEPSDDKNPIPGGVDMTGEQFERPMILRDPEVRSLLSGKSSGDDNWRLTFISIDLKLGPISAIKHTLQPLGVRVIQKNLSPYCYLTDTCSNLEVINQTTAFRSTATDAHALWAHYKNDPEFKNADGFICVYPTSLCEAMMPFGKTLIMIIDGRYELGRSDREAWLAWNEQFTKAAHDTNNIVLTTNGYDKEYVKYFTHVTLPVVPYSCSYVTQRYDPRKSSYLLMPIKKTGFEKMLLKRFEAEATAYGMDVGLAYVLDLYGESYTTKDLVQHPGLVIVPHQVAYLALTELMRLNIPLFFPTVELLARWQADAHIMDRSLHGSGTATMHRRNSPLAGVGGIPDPNDDANDWAIGYWLTFADFFSWPGVKYFDSVENLAVMMNGTTGEDLYYASQRARVFNEHEKANVHDFWKMEIDRLTAGKQ